MSPPARSYTAEIMPPSDPERFEYLSRTSGCMAALVLSFGLVMLGIMGSILLFTKDLRAVNLTAKLIVLFGIAFGIFLLQGGIRMLRHLGAVEYALRGDSEGFQWGKTGSEFSVRFADIAEIEYDDMLGDSSQTTIRMKDGNTLVIPAYFTNHSGAFRYMRRHFRGPMIWRGKRIDSPDARLY